MIHRYLVVWTVTLRDRAQKTATLHELAYSATDAVLQTGTNIDTQIGEPLATRHVTLIRPWLAELDGPWTGLPDPTAPRLITS